MKSSAGPKSTYEVGYGKPPQHSRFKAGQSGNPKGRPKGVVSLATALNRALKERVVVIEDGQRKSISKLEAAVKGMVNRAVKGDARALQQLLVLAPAIEAETAGSADLQSASDSAVLATLIKRFEWANSQDPTSEPQDKGEVFS